VTGNTITGTNNRGGGLGVYHGSLTVDRSTVSNNTVPNGNGFGGGIWTNGAPAVIRNSTISGNNVVGDGGGIFAGGEASIQGSAIFDNSAHNGGGVYSSSNDPNNLTIERSTITYNGATTDDGGGIWFCCGDGEKLTLQGATVTGNTSLKTGGAVE